MTTWLTQLIGIPFEEKGRTPAGCDCWGLVRLALAQGFGVSVPDYSEAYVTSEDRGEIAALMGRESLGWLELPQTSAQPGDVVLFRIRGLVCHAGLVLTPPRFLHCQRPIGAALERWDSPLWARRVAGVLRHPKLGAA